MKSIYLDWSEMDAAVKKWFRTFFSEVADEGNNNPFIVSADRDDTDFCIQLMSKISHPDPAVMKPYIEKLNECLAANADLAESYDDDWEISTMTVSCTLTGNFFIMLPKELSFRLIEPFVGFAADSCCAIEDGVYLFCPEDVVELRRLLGDLTSDWENYSRNAGYFSPEENEATASRIDTTIKTMRALLDSSGAKEKEKQKMSDFVLTEERKDALFQEMLAQAMDKYGHSDELLYRALCDKARMTVDELHEYSIESLDEFIKELRDKAKRNWYDVRELFKLHNLGEIEKPMTDRTVLEARVIVAASSFGQTYSPESRTYMFRSDNKAFLPGMNGSSVFGTSVDLSDKNVRLDAYIGAGLWIPDGCFVMDTGNLTDAEREFCDKSGIPIVHEVDPCYPVWPEPFSTMYKN